MTTQTIGVSAVRLLHAGVQYKDLQAALDALQAHLTNRYASEGASFLCYMNKNTAENIYLPENNKLKLYLEMLRWDPTVGWVRPSEAGHQPNPAIPVYSLLVCKSQENVVWALAFLHAKHPNIYYKLGVESLMITDHPQAEGFSKVLPQLGQSMTAKWLWGLQQQESRRG